MKSRRRAPVKRYRITYDKLEAGVFVLLLLVVTGASFGFGYFWGARGASSEVAGVAAEPAGLERGKGENAAPKAVVALKMTPERKKPPEREVADKPAAPIQPKFYLDLLKEGQENEQPIEPIKLPVMRKKRAPETTPPPPPVAAVEKPPEEKVAEPKVVEKQDDMDALDEELKKQAAASLRASKPWTKASGYTIQVISVKTFDEALRTVRRLRNTGFQPYIRNADLGARGTWYRVRVGHYRDKEEARKALSEIRAKMNLVGAKIAPM